MTAAVGLSVDYQTWLALARTQGLSEVEAVEVMVQLVRGAACDSTVSA
jgi:hypothetical protein